MQSNRQREREREKIEIKKILREKDRVTDKMRKRANFWRPTVHA